MGPEAGVGGKAWARGNAQHGAREASLRSCREVLQKVMFTAEGGGEKAGIKNNRQKGYVAWRYDQAASS